MNKQFLKLQKIQKPCYFYNTGGCYNDNGTPKSESDCKYLHCKINEPLEKPQHLKPPCKYYHLRKICTNNYCVFGHCELSYERWLQYFPTHEYPGQDYTINNNHIWETNVENENETKNLGDNKKQLKTAILLMLLQNMD